MGGREGDTFISPAEQNRSIDAGVAAGKHELVDRLEDLDEPGSKLDRPGLTAAMARVEAGQADGIIVAKLDRFTRSTAHLGPLLERLRAAGGVLVSVNEGIDTSTSTGKLVADIMGAISEWELTRIRDNWRAARAAAVERGVHVTGTVPLGYRKTDEGKLEPGPEAHAVRELFRSRAGGTSWAKLANWLTGATGGQRTYTVGGIKSIIGNRVYLGEARAGQGITKLAAHPPLVDRDVFEAANRARGVAPGRSGRASGLLSGILRCAGCRYSLKPSLRGDGRLEYRCKSSRGETAGGRCSSPASVSAVVIEPVVLERFWDFVGDYEAHFADPEPELDQVREAVMVARAELDAALDRSLVEALGGDGSAAYLELVRRRREALDAALAAEAELAGQRQPAQPPAQVRELWPDLSLDEQRRLLASVFDCVFVRRTPNAGGRVPVAGRIYFCFAGDGPELPRQGVKWTPQPFEWGASSGQDGA